MSAEPAITVTPTVIQGLEVIGPASPAYSEEASRLLGGITPELSPLLKYGVIVRNTGKLAVTGIDVLYELDIENRRVTKNYLYSSPDMASELLPVIAPNTAMLLVPEHAVNSLAVDRRQITVPAEVAKRIRDTVAFLSTARNVTVSVDSVVRSDGMLTGPDRAGTLNKFRRSIEGYQVFREDLISRLNRGEPNEAIVAWLKQLADARVMKVRPEVPTDRATIVQKQLAQEYLGYLTAGNRSGALQDLIQKTPETQMRQIIRVKRGKE